MDQLAAKLGTDPVELRRVNETDHEAIKGLPYTPRMLMPCFDAAAAALGWAKRDPKPGSMRDGDWLVGWGCATSLSPASMGPAAVRVTLSPGGARNRQGITTVLALVAVSGLREAEGSRPVRLRRTVCGSPGPFPDP